MRAIVIGSGIAGPVAAVALLRAGIQAELFEALPEPAEFRGLFLGLGVNGMRVLRQLGLLEAVQREDVIPTPVMEFTSSSGKRLGRVSNGWLGRATPSITVMRGTLHRVLADEARARGIGIHYGRRLVDYRATGNQVVARFDDGSTATGDLLLGADGIRSRVRAILLPHAPAPRYTGLLNLGGVVRGSGLPPTPDIMHMVWGKRAFFGYTVRPDGEAWWFANPGQPEEPGRGELAETTSDEWKRRLSEMFTGDPAFIAKLIEATDEVDAFPIHDVPSLPAWHSGRVALIGDAAHAVSPSAGQGASLAMEDALMLGRCLSDEPDPEAALASYEALRRPRAERIVAAGRRRGAYKAPRTRAGRALRDLFMPVALRLFARESAMSWIYDYEIEWDGYAEATAA